MNNTKLKTIFFELLSAFQKLGTQADLISLVILFLIVSISTGQLMAQRNLTTKAGATIRAYSAEDGVPGSNFSNSIVTNDGFVWLSSTSGVVRMSGGEIEDFGSEYGIPLMRQMHYDRKQNILWFTNGENLIKYDHNQIVRYDAANGFALPGGARKEVLSMLTDSHDRLWIGSFTPPLNTPDHGGLVRLENGSFTTIPKETLPLHDVAGIFEASDGTLWFTSLGYQADGFNNNYAWLAKYKDNAFQVFDTLCPCMNVAHIFHDRDGLKPAIVEDKHGDLWFYCNGRTSTSDFSSDKRGLFIYREGLFEPVHEVNEKLKNNLFINDIAYDEKKDELYISIRKNEGLTLSDVPELVMVRRNGEWKYESIVEAEELEALLSLDYEVAKLMPIQAFILRLTDERMIASFLIVDMTTGRWFSVLFEKHGNTWKWVDTLPGVIIMNAEESSYLTVLQEPDFIGVYIPPNANLLTDADGMNKMPTEGGQLFTDADGNVWITYSNRWDASTQSWNSAGLNMWDGEKLHSFSIDDGLTSNTVFEPTQTTDGTLWFPSDNGVNRFIKEGESYQISKINTENGQPFRVSDAVEMNNGNIYFYQAFVNPKTEEHPGYASFVGRYNNGFVEPVDIPFPDSLAMMPYQQFELYSDHFNRLWMLGRFASSDNALGTAVTHIRVLDNENWTDPTNDWHVPNKRLYYVGELASGIYFVVNEGFYKFDFDRKRFIDLTDSTSAKTDFRILQQVNTWNMRFNIQGGDHLYIRLRDRGVVVFDETHLSYLDRRNGLPSLQLLWPNIDRNGDVLFTVPNGGIVFNGTEFMYIRDNALKDGTPRAIARDKYQNLLILYQGLGITVTKLDTIHYPARLSTIWIDGQRFFEGQSVKLGSKQNNIEFRFANLNFSKPENVQYTYFLDGFDHDWSRPTKVNFMEYRNLPAGNYTFRLKGISPGNIFSDEAVFTFSIAPPWYRTTVAWIAYAIFLLLLIYFTERFLRQRAVARERERAREKELQQAREIEKAYTELKATQAQLIQSEKMASLGELTAGIAHEIQNPLNFVNNFSEVSKELINEMNDELAVGNWQLAKEISGDIEQNLEKINHHGKRADAIVKGMLQHSRASSGQKEPTDLNALADEYLRLSYHGIRAKDKTFFADFATDLDPSLPKVEVVPQDIGRVLLNLINNAFHACAEGSRNAVDQRQKNNGEKDFKPMVNVSTRLHGDKVQISVKDNGTGIPDDIKNKIFQPFFTTKPTGQGTGLGLSISFDIVKMHGGQLKLETTEGAGTEFIVELPITK